VRLRTDRQTHAETDTNWIYNLPHAICYSSGADNKVKRCWLLQKQLFAIRRRWVSVTEFAIQLNLDMSTFTVPARYVRFEVRHKRAMTTSLNADWLPSRWQSWQWVSGSSVTTRDPLTRDDCRATSRVDSEPVGLAELTVGQWVIGHYPWPVDPWPIRATSRVDSGSVGHRSVPVTRWPVTHSSH